MDPNDPVLAELKALRHEVNKLVVYDVVILLMVILLGLYLRTA